MFFWVLLLFLFFYFFFQAEDGIRDATVTGVQTCALPILPSSGDETLYLTERAAGRGIFTFRPLAADLYWIRAIQYFGGRSRVARLQQAEIGRASCRERVEL